MGMGIVTDKEFESSLKDSSPRTIPSPIPSPNKPLEGVLIGEVIDKIPKGRGKGNVEIPDPLRQLIGEESAINGRASALHLAEQFGISKSSVSAYANGSTSTASYDSRPNLEKLNEGKLRVASRARRKLMQALGKISSDKLEVSSARDLSGVAKDMSAIIKNMEPDSPTGHNGGNEGPKFIFYAPQFNKEDHYEVVHVKE